MRVGIGMWSTWSSVREPNFPVVRRPYAKPRRLQERLPAGRIATKHFLRSTRQYFSVGLEMRIGVERRDADGLGADCERLRRLEQAPDQTKTIIAGTMRAQIPRQPSRSRRSQSFAAEYNRRCCRLVSERRFQSAGAFQSGGRRATWSTKEMEAAPHVRTPTRPIGCTPDRYLVSARLNGANRWEVAPLRRVGHGSVREVNGRQLDLGSPFFFSWPIH